MCLPPSPNTIIIVGGLLNSTAFTNPSSPVCKHRELSKYRPPRRNSAGGTLNDTRRIEISVPVKYFPTKAIAPCGASALSVRKPTDGEVGVLGTFLPVSNSHIDQAPSFHQTLLYKIGLIPMIDLRRAQEVPSPTFPTKEPCHLHPRAKVLWDSARMSSK